MPNYLCLTGRMLSYLAPGKLAAMYPVRQTGAARALFLFRRTEELVYDYRDVQRHKLLLREAFAADGWEVPRLLAELESADDFYFDSISQVIMDTWSRGRVTLVGDAGYCPGPAVGGGTSVAIVGAYVLAGELREAGGDHTAAFLAYENQMRAFVRRNSAVAPTTMKTLIPRTPLQVWLTPQAIRLLTRLPLAIRQGLLSLQAGPARAIGAMTLKHYEPIR
jgi:2-polyprenyl-6-methoxyphenol hydroxylase-like FAD-dependent oxidoreductase